MTSNTPDKNFGIDPEKADELREKAKHLVKRIVGGDPEALRTLKHLQILATMAAKEAGREL